MRNKRQVNTVIFVSLLTIALAFVICATMVMRWFSTPKSSALAVRISPAAQLELDDARREFRENLLDPRSHLRLSQALWKAGREIDSFYVMHAARQLFPDEAFRRAHAEIVIGVGGPAADALARLKDVKDPALIIPILAESGRNSPDTPEGRDALSRLSSMAADANSGRETSETALEALTELYRLNPKNAETLAALGSALIARGEDAKAAAFAQQALNKFPTHAGADRVMGMLALKVHDVDSARKWLNAAWEQNSNDLYSAAKLAQIYDKLRGDSEAALPFYLALYHENPDFEDGDSADARIRRTLDDRRARLLKTATVEALGSRFALDDASLRAEAALHAADFKDPRWIDALGGLLDDDCEIVRRNADYALYRIGQSHPEDLRARRDAWLGTDKPLQHIRALNLFDDLDGKDVLPATVSALSDPNPGVRAYAAIMVLDHYFADEPEAARARARMLAAEKDPAVVDFVRRFSVRAP